MNLKHVIAILLAVPTVASGNKLRGSPKKEGTVDEGEGRRLLKNDNKNRTRYRANRVARRNIFRRNKADRTGLSLDYDDYIDRKADRIRNRAKKDYDYIDRDVDRIRNYLVYDYVDRDVDRIRNYRDYDYVDRDVDRIRNRYDRDAARHSIGCDIYVDVCLPADASDPSDVCDNDGRHCDDLDDDLDLLPPVTSKLTAAQKRQNQRDYRRTWFNPDRSFNEDRMERDRKDEQAFLRGNRLADPYHIYGDPWYAKNREELRAVRCELWDTDCYWHALEYDSEDGSYDYDPRHNRHFRDPWP